MVQRPFSTEGFRAVAQRRLPRAIFDFVDGAAGDELTMRRNRDAFADVSFMPSTLTDVSTTDISTSVAGVPMSSPVMLAPAGLVGMVHPDGELGAVTAASRHGSIAVVSSASTYSIEELMATGPAVSPWFQVYPYRDRSFYGELVARAAEAGVAGLCLTVDAPVSGKRERDLANHMTAKPFRITARNAFDGAMHPRWLRGVLQERRVVAKVTSEGRGEDKPSLMSLMGKAGASAADVVELLPKGATWDDLAWLRETWSGPLAVKGVLNPADAARAATIGVDALIVSNHGGRQLDSAIGSLDALPAVADAVGDRVDLVLDGGVRRGSDVVKAVALGAKACMVGRPWVYALAASGTQGVIDLLDLLDEEVRITLALLGQAALRDVDSSYLASAR